ncbi:DUF4097 family beta strand repeat-containing protein [Pelagicoccus sp. SDUM812002]|uniref:DUF4097 family beta strand repeat-containing protein n=1 Tax=Pelagicoccus sp. SDUM812002 TaxID=3041266 RepID=UPI00280FC1C2|nr:DUF4097 family beta strand repeat-containing protein [Pelagicoccus sp. SDUM812002]MDQ8188133.1 DUF4097 family beta strand repeat-containing protein [Pelagicoccus sp. SDUM812002]
MNTKRILQPLLTIAAASLVFTTTAFTADEVQNHQLDGIKKVSFYISKSNVTLIGSDRTDLELTLEKPLTGFDPDKITQTTSQQGDTLVIKIEYDKEPSSWFSWGDGVKGYKEATLLVPSSLLAEIRTSGGNVSAEAMSASLSLKTSGGNITAADISAPLDIKTSGGNIRLKQIKGDTNAHTSGGNISVEGLVGKVDLHTSGGNMDISGEISALTAHTSGGHINADIKSALIEPLELKTSGGNVNAILFAGMKAPASLSTSGGSVSISLPRDQAFQIYAKSNGGDVSLNHGGSFQGSLDKKKIEGDVNGGGPLVKMTTNGGRVNIKEI